MSVRGAGSSDPAKPEAVRGAGSLDPASGSRGAGSSDPASGSRGAGSSDPASGSRGAGSSDPAKTNGRRILLVDDEPGLRRTLSDRLRKEGYGVDTAATGDVALDLARKGHYDLIILDLNLPAKDGLQVCHELRREGQNVAVLMLTARDTTADKITGLKSGADDYMTKPFESAELLARIEALLRRTRADAVPDELTFGDVVVRPRAGQVLRGGKAVRLSAQEFKLLVHLVRHPGVVLSRDELLDAVWGYQATPETRTVDVHVSWLRQKLEPDPHNPRYIVTVYGLGYRFEN